MAAPSLRLTIGLIILILALWWVLQIVLIPLADPYPGNLLGILRWCSTWRDQIEALTCLEQHDVILVIKP